MSRAQFTKHLIEMEFYLNLLQQGDRKNESTATFIK